MIATKLWWDDGARATVEAGEQTHVFAAGDHILNALRLAIDHPDTVLSLVLAEPVSITEEIAELLPQITVPTLVLASAPTSDADLTAAQRLAGEIDNGVFVIIDGAPKPVHTESRASFTEWSLSFVAIAEGLAARDGRLLTPPTPLLEGAIR